MSSISDYSHWNEEAPRVWAAEQSPYPEEPDSDPYDDWGGRWHDEDRAGDYADAQAEREADIEDDPGIPPDECLDYDPSEPRRCSGQVEYRMPLSGTGRSFLRCEAHWAERLKEQERINRDYPDSPIAPSWFDPAAAGERWDDDY